MQRCKERQEPPQALLRSTFQERLPRGVRRTNRSVLASDFF